jgi:hypothetical protein
MSKQAFQKVHKDTSGAAMIVVVCVLMVVMILCLTMIVGAYQTLATVQDGRRDMLTYQQALSLSEVLKSKLVTNGTIKDAPTNTTALEDAIIDFALKETGYTVGADGVESASIVLSTSSVSPDPSGGNLGLIEIALQKRKQGDARRRLFVTVSILEGTKNYVANCEAGYDLELSGSASDRKYTCVFKGYY